MENPLEPAEIPGARLKRGIFGYNRPMVDRFIEDITTCYEDVWDDRLRLRDSLATLEEELDRYRSHERELGEALIEAKLAAARIVMDAEQKSAGIMRSAELASERSLAASARSRPPWTSGADGWRSWSGVSRSAWSSPASLCRMHARC